MFGDEIQRVTGRKDEYHEVEEFICNECRFDEKDSVINQNNYTRKLGKVEIATEKNILLGRDMDRKKISMHDVALTEEDIINQKKLGNNG